MDWTGFVKHGFVRKCIRKSKQNQTIYLFHSYAKRFFYQLPSECIASILRIHLSISWQQHWAACQQHWNRPNVPLLSSFLIVMEFHENSGNSKGGLRILEIDGSLNAANSTRGIQTFALFLNYAKLSGHPGWNFLCKGKGKMDKKRRTGMFSKGWENWRIGGSN